MRHLFIVNPVAGKLRLEEKLGRISRALDLLPQELRRGAEFETYVATAPMDACAKITREAEKGDELRVYACGGDGTLNECVCGAALRQNVSVTHFPCGTGNDFIKTFGADKKRFFDLTELVSGEVRPIDIIDCGDRYSINICSMGVDAHVGADVHKYSRIPVIGGATGYVASTAVNYVKGLSYRMTARAEGLTCGPELNMVCVCNGRYYGGGFNPTGDSRPDDGMLDCLIVSGVNRLKFMGAIFGYARGQYKKLPQYITFVRTPEITVESARPEVVNIDGEVELRDRITFRVVPGGVNFIFPRNMAFFA